MRRTVSWLATLALLLAAHAASARKPEDAFGGKILISDKAFPSKAGSPNAYIAALQKQSKKAIWEDKANKEWKIFYAAFFRKPLNDLEVTVKFYDVTKGQRRMIESYEQYLGGRGERAIVGNCKLKRGDDGSGYEPNSKIWMVMENRGKVIAEAFFDINGEGRKFSGKVEFTEDEVNQKGEIEDKDKK